MDELWNLAQDKATAQADRVRLWQWFVAMGVGTPRQMAAQDAAPKGGGVVVLPEVMAATEPPDLTV